MKYDLELESPLSYKTAPQSVKDKCCNACGAQGWKVDIVPDNILGVDISEACNIHDWMYREAVDTRKECDRIFRRNMTRLVISEKSDFKRYWRRVLVWWYWRGVRRFGGPSYLG